MPSTKDIPAVTDAEALAADAKAIEAEMQASEDRQESLKGNLKAEKEHWPACCRSSAAWCRKRIRFSRSDE